MALFAVPTWVGASLLNVFSGFASPLENLRFGAHYAVPYTL